LFSSDLFRPVLRVRQPVRALPDLHRAGRANVSGQTEDGDAASYLCCLRLCLPRHAQQ
jgi:hypothetical protein